MNKSTLFAAIAALTATATVTTASADARRRDYRKAPVVAKKARVLRVPASITSFAPHSGAAGTVVTINGRRFTAGTRILFDGKVIAPTKLGRKQIQFAIPAGSKDAVIRLRQPGVRAFAVGTFDVTQPQINRWNANLRKQRAEKRLHAKRMAKLQRMKVLAGNDVFLEQRIQRLIRLENRRHQRKMRALRYATAPRNRARA